MKTFFYQPTQVYYRLGNISGFGIAFQNHLILENGQAVVIRYEVDSLTELDWKNLGLFLSEDLETEEEALD